MKYLIALSCIAFLSACEDPSRVDQCERKELFKQCMNMLPAGPNETKYNDWDEVVDRCDTIALHQSVKPATFVKKECRTS